MEILVWHDKRANVYIDGSDLDAAYGYVFDRINEYGYYTDYGSMEKKQQALYNRGLEGDLEAKRRLVHYRNAEGCEYEWVEQVTLIDPTNGETEYIK